MAVPAQGSSPNTYLITGMSENAYGQKRIYGSIEDIGSASSWKQVNINGGYNPAFVAVGTNSLILTSPDGQNWTPAQSQ